MTYRVIMWGTGVCGISALKYLLKRKDMELVGLRVFTPEKDGKTAAEIADMPGSPQGGVIATRDEEALIAVDADAVVFMDSDRTLTDPRIAGTEAHMMVDKMCRILESGKNIVATTVVGMCHPPYYGPGVYDRIDAACAKGGTSIFTTGIEPGFMGDDLPMMLSGLVDDIRTVRTTQFLDYSQYHHEGTFNAYGFGKRPDDPTLANTAHSNRYKIAWEVVPHIVADGLGVTLDDVVLRTYVAITDFAFDTFAGRIDPGTVAAHRFEIVGIVGGEERIILEHISRIHDDAAPHWESMGRGKGGFRVKIEGSPSMTVDIQLGLDPGRTPTADACQITACRAVNAIPYVIEASPGAKRIVDLPTIIGRGVMG